MAACCSLLPFKTAATIKLEGWGGHRFQTLFDHIFYGERGLELLCVKEALTPEEMSQVEQLPGPCVRGMVLPSLKGRGAEVTCSH